MQTFLPYSNFVKTAKVLDNKRLGKQRVEAYQILKALENPNYGWQHHPAVKMWRGYEEALLAYLFAVCSEWHLVRGYKDNILFGENRVSSLKVWNNRFENLRFPSFLRSEKLCISHQSNLLRKNEEHYRKFFRNIKSNIPYYWPVV